MRTTAIRVRRGGTPRLHITNRILLDYILILFENNSVPELHSHVCCCPVELVLDGNILLYNDVLSLRLSIWTMKVGLIGQKDILNFDIYLGIFCVNKNV